MEWDFFDEMERIKAKEEQIRRFACMPTTWGSKASYYVNSNNIKVRGNQQEDDNDDYELEGTKDMSTDESKSSSKKKADMSTDSMELFLGSGTIIELVSEENINKVEGQREEKDKEKSRNEDLTGREGDGQRERKDKEEYQKEDSTGKRGGNEPVDLTHGMFSNKASSWHEDDSSISSDDEKVEHSEIFETDSDKGKSNRNKKEKLPFLSPLYTRSNSRHQQHQQHQQHGDLQQQQQKYQASDHLEQTINHRDSKAQPFDTQRIQRMRCSQWERIKD